MPKRTTRKPKPKSRLMPDLFRLAMETSLHEHAQRVAYTISALHARYPEGAWFNEVNRLVGYEMHMARRRD